MVRGDANSSSATLSERWSSVGRGAAVTVDSVELWTVELPFRDPVATAIGVHRTRPLVLVHLVGGAGGADDKVLVEGWGECAALADATFDDEDVASSLEILRDQLVPALFELAAAEGRCLPGPSALGQVRSAVAGAPLAFAGLEMAVADAHLRAEQRSLAALLGVEGRIVEPGAVVGTADTIDELLAAVGRLVDQGYSRVKVKIAPNWDVVPIAALSEAFPGLRLQADANGSYRPGSRDRTGTGGGDDAHLAALDHFGLLCIEQPFDRADLPAHARLAARMSTPICLDESLDSPEAVREALAVKACSVVCVKPARLGGLGAALWVIDECRQSGVPLWMGGMFESGYARGVNTTLGALEGMSWPGDLSPTRSYLEDDLVDDLVGIAGAVPDGAHVQPARAVPRGPGMGPPPTAEALARYGALRHVITGPPG